MRSSQRLWFAGVSYALVWGLVVLGLLGPLALLAALAALIVAASLQLREAGALVLTIGGAMAGMVLLGLDGAGWSVQSRRWPRSIAPMCCPEARSPTW